MPYSPYQGCTEGVRDGAHSKTKGDNGSIGDCGLDAPTKRPITLMGLAPQTLSQDHAQCLLCYDSLKEIICKRIGRLWIDDSGFSCNPT